MSYLQPFFLLLGRASVFWIGSAVLASLAFILLVLGQPDEILTPYVNVAFVAALGLPMAAGWLGGAVIQEFQHCTCAWPLPGVNRRLGAGFLAAGLVITLIVAGLVFQAHSNNLHFTTLFVLSLAGYCLGGTFFDPLRPWMATVTIVLALLTVSRSLFLSELVASYPVTSMLLAASLATLSLSRLFSRSTLRRRPFQPTSPFPGSYSVERSAEFERGKLAARKPHQSKDWRAGYLDGSTWNWVRAAVYEGYGPVDWKTLIKIPSRLWALGLVFALHAWANRGSMDFGEALARTMFEALLQSPQAPPLVERGEHDPIVIIVVAAMGAALAISGPSSLSKTSLVYPISRRFQAGVTFWAGVVDIAVFFVGIALTLGFLGYLSGWLVGYPPRFDFIPFFFRPLAVTAILMPPALWGHLRLHIANRRRTENTIVALVFGVIGFVAVAWIATAFIPRLIPWPTAEIGVLTVLFVISLVAYASKLREYFSTADVV